MGVAVFVWQMVVNIVVPWLVLRWCERLSPPEDLARAWNVASFWSAVVMFGPLCVPVHFAKVGFGPRAWGRAARTIVGFALGLVVMVAVLVVSGLLILPLAMLEEPTP